jgi:DUF4097 and DUF4098 domain-containing protein YvlB
MGAYPPQPPPGGPYPPPYGREARRAQRRFAQNQARVYRNQMRMQRRMARRGSAVGPLILLALGVVFLLAQMGRISWPQMLEWYGRWWAAILVLAGMILLLEWAIDQWRPVVAGGVRPVRVMGGGVVLLLVLLVLAGLSTRAVETGLNWRDRAMGQDFGQLDQFFGDRHDGYSTVSAGLAAGGTLAILDPRGDVTVTGGSADGQVHVSVHTQAYAWKNREAQRKIQQLQPMFSGDRNNLVLAVRTVDGGQADLTVTVPSTTALTVNADHGDVNLSELQAPVALSANHGDVDMSAIGAAVRVNVNDDDANLTLHTIAGPVTIEGHSGDVDIEDVSGSLQMQGDFYGTTDLQHVSGPVRFATSRTQFSAARLDGEFSVASDSLDASAVLGPVALKTENKNITLDRVQGDVDVADDNGTVELTAVPPAATIAIEDRHGSVDVGLPAGAGFVLDARTRNGDMENDFGLTPQENNETHTLRGTVGGGGPAVTIATSDGDVTVRKSTVAPLPPATPRITTAPAGPRAPRAPEPPVAGTVF